MMKTENVLEAILYLAGVEVEIAEIAEKLEITPAEVMTAAEKLKKKYGGACGIHLRIFNKKLQFVSNPDYAERVSAVLNPVKEKELSSSMMETISIIAYKQPITRLEIDRIRGVSSDYALQALTKSGLIKVVGRKDAIGKPVLLGTTDEFLKRFNIPSLEALPAEEELKERLGVEEEPQSEELYHRNEYGEIDMDEKALDRLEIEHIPEPQSEVLEQAASETPENAPETNDQNHTDQRIKRKKSRNLNASVPSEEWDLSQEEIPDFLKGEEIALIDGGGDK